jgi:hypothetical protein
LIIIFNWIGLGVCVVGLGIGFMIGRLAHASDDHLMMLIGGPIMVALDLAYRKGAETGHWIRPRGGGHFFYIPAWIWGAVFFLGAGTMSQARRSREPAKPQRPAASSPAPAGIPQAEPAAASFTATASLPAAEQGRLRVFESMGCKLSAPATWTTKDTPTNTEARLVIADPTGSASVGIHFESSPGRELTQRDVKELMAKANRMPLRLEDSTWSAIGDHKAWREVRTGELGGTHRTWIRYSYHADSAVVQVIGMLTGSRSRDDRRLLESILLSADCGH